MSAGTGAAEILGLDHVVIAVHDLDAAVASYRSLGFTVQPGGRHPGRTSHNALIVFADGAYIELIAWVAPAPQERWWQVLQAHGEGYVDFALLPRDTAAALEAARGRGLHTLTGPLEGGRVRPDGAQLQWRTARHETPDLPFLCGDVTPRALRVPEGAVRQHANGALGVAELALAVDDLDATLARYRALLGSDATVTADIESPDLPRGMYTLGTTRFMVTATASSQTRGEGVTSLRLRGLPSTLPRQASHGALIEGESRSDGVP
jgi:catechol 2,3-dioxygenase-like lactoylglutathione lyase family enzyme